jgi:phytoene dehydrogenase-like protein
MNMRKQLTLLAVFAILVGVGMGGAASVGMRQAASAAEELVEWSLPHVIKLGNAKEIFRESVDAARQYSLSPGEETRAVYFAQKEAFVESRAELERHVASRPASLGGADSAFLEEIRTQSQAFFALVEADWEVLPELGDQAAPREAPLFRTEETSLLALFGAYQDEEYQRVARAREHTDSIRAAFETFILLCSGLSLVVTGLWYFSVRERLLKPLRGLVATAARWATPDSRAALSSSGETGMSLVQETLEALANDIVQSKMNLEAQVQARTTEMKKQLDELERMNTLMIDRELTMIELKKQNTALKNSSGMPSDVG